MIAVYKTELEIELQLHTMRRDEPERFIRLAKALTGTKLYQKLNRLGIRCWYVGDEKYSYQDMDELIIAMSQIIAERYPADMLEPIPDDLNNSEILELIRRTNP